MRALPFLSVLLVGASCRVHVSQQAPVLQVAVKATVTAEARVEPQPAVELEGAPVVEFFGIPLEDAQDVVFVLDRSGSMNELAQGRIALLGAPADPPAESPDTPPTESPDAPPTESPDAPPTESPDAPPQDTQPNPPAESADAPPLDAPDSAAPVAVVAAPRTPTKIEVARRELIEAIERLPPGTRVNVVFFNNTLEAFGQTMVPLDDPDRAALIAFVRDTVADGRTALAPAMRAAFLLNAHRVVLLSDGLGNLGGDAQAVLRDAREAMLGGVRIDAIGLGLRQDARLLRSLAQESGGLYQPL